MTKTCRGDWRCRRICKVGRSTSRTRPPRCVRQVFGANPGPRATRALQRFGAPTPANLNAGARDDILIAAE